MFQHPEAAFNVSQRLIALNDLSGLEVDRPGDRQQLSVYQLRIPPESA
jgi:hypothetical protein